MMTGLKLRKFYLHFSQILAIFSNFSKEMGIEATCISKKIGSLTSAKVAIYFKFFAFFVTLWKEKCVIIHPQKCKLNFCAKLTPSNNSAFSAALAAALEL